MEEELTTQKYPTPEEGKQSLQYDLFSKFLTSREDDVSNTIHFWETIPKYFFTKDMVARLRQPTGLAEPYSWIFNKIPIERKVTLSPALIQQEDGNYKAFFPGVTEELVEEALKKILADQRYGLHDTSDTKTWVFWTWKMLQKELKDKNKSRSIQEIKHAVTVMSECVVKYYENGDEVWKGTILQDLITMGRDEYLEGTSKYHAARLPVYISHAINKHDVRQFNYRNHMSLKRPLARWLFKQFIHKYIYANPTRSYHFRYQELKINSALLQQKSEDKNRKKVEEALNELVEKDVLLTWALEYKKDKKKNNQIVDVVYTVYSSEKFKSEQQQANMRIGDVKEIGKNNNLKLGDKLS